MRTGIPSRWRINSKEILKMEQIKLFIEKAKSDSALMAKLDALGAKNAGVGEFVALAAEHGFAISAGEYEEAVKCGGNCSRCGELNEQELDTVSGGGSQHGDPTQNRYDPNVCVPSLGRTRYECVVHESDMVRSLLHGESSRQHD
jgi:predicted ribosomally synthesized peptide with nif11-like leader